MDRRTLLAGATTGIATLIAGCSSSNPSSNTGSTPDTTATASSTAEPTDTPVETPEPVDGVVGDTIESGGIGFRLLPGETASQYEYEYGTRTAIEGSQYVSFNLRLENVGESSVTFNPFENLSCTYRGVEQPVTAYNFNGGNINGSSLLSWNAPQTGKITLRPGDITTGSLICTVPKESFSPADITIREDISGDVTFAGGSGSRSPLYNSPQNTGGSYEFGEAAQSASGAMYSATTHTLADTITTDVTTTDGNTNTPPDGKQYLIVEFTVENNTPVGTPLFERPTLTYNDSPVDGGGYAEEVFTANETTFVGMYTQKFGRSRLEDSSEPLSTDGSFVFPGATASGALVWVVPGTFDESNFTLTINEDTPITFTP